MDPTLENSDNTVQDPDESVTKTISDTTHPEREVRMKTSLSYKHSLQSMCHGSSVLLNLRIGPMRH